MREKRHTVRRFLKYLYLKLFRIHDTPQRIALGLGVGVFMGLIPGTGPIAAVVIAIVLRVNRASALLGSILTNTWLSILTFFLSIKIGSAIIRVDWHEAHRGWMEFLKDFRFTSFFKLATLKVIMPVLTGYIIVGLCLGSIAYLTALLIIKAIKHESKNRAHVSR